MTEPTHDYPAVYADVRTRLSALVGPLDDAVLATIVPATPDWRVRDAVAHMTGIVSDLLEGNFAGLGTDEWTAAHVAARRDVPFSKVLDEWSTKSPVLEATLTEAPPELAALLIGDLACHDFDVRGGLGDRDGRESEATAIAVNLYADGMVGRVTQAGLAPLRVESTDGQAWGADAGDAAAAVRASSFELLRAITGRRSAEQIRALDWTGDPEPYLPLFATYPMRANALEE